MLLFIVFIVLLHMFPVSSYAVVGLHDILQITGTPRMDGVWFHIVLNFFGFNDTQGITVYHDGVQLNKTAERNSFSGNFYVSDRRIILGRIADELTCPTCPTSDPYLYYSSISIDELLFYNHILTDQQIMKMIQ